MTKPEKTFSRTTTLADIVDHLLDRGTVVAGEATLSLAGIDLVYLKLNLVLASVAALERPPNRAALRLVPAQPADGPPRRETLPGAPALALAPEAAERQTRADVGATPPRDTGPLKDVLLGRTPDEPAGPTPAGSPLPATGEERPERGLAQLVLTLVELLRQVVERQALRRVEGGGLTDAQVERMGLALQELESKMGVLREMFGLEEGDLDLDLGPLERLLS